MGISLLYLGTQYGLRVWQGEGASWEENREAFQSKVIDAIAGSFHDPRTVYVGIAHDGLYRSRNSGAQWDRVFSGDVRAVTVDPSDEGTVYLGTEPVHLYRSSDGGSHWEELEGVMQLPETVKTRWWFPRPPHEGHVRHIFIDPKNRAIIYLALEHGGIIRTLDGGEKWQDVSDGIDYLDIHFVTNFPLDDSLFSASTAQGFYRTLDPSQGWTKAESGLSNKFCYNVVFFPGAPPTMLLATGDGSPAYWDRPGVARSVIYRSVDHAESWGPVAGGMPDRLEAMPWTMIGHSKDRDAAFAGFGQVSKGRAEVDLSKDWEKTAGQLGEVWATFNRGQNWEKLPIQSPAVRSMWVA